MEKRAYIVVETFLKSLQCRITNWPFLNRVHGISDPGEWRTPLHCRSRIYKRIIRATDPETHD